MDLLSAIADVSLGQGVNVGLDRAQVVDVLDGRVDELHHLQTLGRLLTLITAELEDGIGVGGPASHATK